MGRPTTAWRSPAATAMPSRSSHRPMAAAARARNRGLAEADQPLIAFLDADDRFLPSKLERQIEFLSGRPDAMLCLCRVCDFWSPDLKIDARRTAMLTPQFRAGQVSTWLARREVFETCRKVRCIVRVPILRGIGVVFAHPEHGTRGGANTGRAGRGRLHGRNTTSDSKGHLDGIMALMKQRLELRRNSA